MIRGICYWSVNSWSRSAKPSRCSSFSMPNSFSKGKSLYFDPNSFSWPCSSSWNPDNMLSSYFSLNNSGYASGRKGVVSSDLSFQNSNIGFSSFLSWSDISGSSPGFQLELLNQAMWFWVRPWRKKFLGLNKEWDKFMVLNNILDFCNILFKLKLK